MYGLNRGAGGGGGAKGRQGGCGASYGRGSMTSRPNPVPSRRGGAFGHRRRNDPLRSDDADDVLTVQTVATKPLDKMTSQDWRIIRENYDIAVRGGKVPSPLRSFRETPLGMAPIHPHIRCHREYVAV